MNTFGSTSNQFALCDPRGIRANRERFRRDRIPALDRANSLYVPAGRWPARGWLLMGRSDYNQLNTYSTALQLNIGDTRQADNVDPIGSLSVVQAQCVTRGLASDAEAIYLVEVTDARGILHNKWFTFPTTSLYNIRAPAYPQTFHPASMNGSTTWTWSTMLQDLWTQMGALLGAWPGLPSAPAGTPEGFWLAGVPAWNTLCDILDELGMVVACDLTKSAPFTIVSTGADDAMFDALQAKYSTTNLEDDLEWIDTGAGRVPKTVQVFFKRRNAVYGTEEAVTYRSDNMAKQWAMTPLYSVTVAAPTQFASASGSHHIWSDFTVRYDINSLPLAADVVTAAAIAAERVTQYFDRIYSRTSGYMSQTYAGALPFATGAQVDGVCWYQDFASDPRQGWRTNIVRGGYPPWPGLVFPQED